MGSEKGILWEVSRGGDLSLLVGAERCRILVLSKVMSLGSPVFAKMLEYNFIEGVSNRKGPNTHCVTLPDDDAEAVALLCRIFHLDTTGLTTFAPARKTLRKLVILCDKYECVALMHPWMALWYPIDNLTDDQIHLGEILFFAFTLDMPRLFKFASWKLLLVQEGPYQLLHGYAQDPDDVLPTALLGRSH